MVKTKKQILIERKEKNRTFEETSALGRLQDRITELESRMDTMEAKK